MAESERYLPTLITKLEDTIVEAGLRNASIVMRMTGCPNGCARPWVAEVACVGKAPGTYNLMLGGGYHGERLNKLYRYASSHFQIIYLTLRRASVNEQEILEILKPMIKQYALERHDGGMSFQRLF
jgi:sulfite reductase (NADPH) hemoprotein beta-component